MNVVNSKVVDRLMKTAKTAELARTDFERFVKSNESREVKFNISCLSNFECDKFVNHEAMDRLKDYSLRLIKLESKDEEEIGNLALNIKYICGVLSRQIKASDAISAMSDGLGLERKNLTGELTGENSQLLVSCLLDLDDSVMSIKGKEGALQSIYETISSMKIVQTCRNEVEERQNVFDGLGKEDKDAYSYAEEKLQESKTELRDAE